ncbi:hypothetical protein CTAM01_11402 [Colletotrichum tamarilloi]|uniref:Uncharacterized protein n=1 Tax=Colletotrichum tamarilloi TaxID=1209934 RepID=A0ABQ9QXR1_9PEZI|nr:uncharacterized protein CTAM01_11402 [Colletotrichum tamarilloi]KAI3542130.1 hypothetical protein CSPX01_07122 [Colletotrichum filicis]KAK1488921.1 hypothetical protein CTAM01_11402 [Colletotrichum tamarilloi]
MASIYGNASWNLDFEGPDIRCSALDADDELRINVTKSATERCSDAYCYRYISWMPESTTDLSSFWPDKKDSTRDAVSGPRDAPISLYVVENNDDGLSDSNMLVLDSFTKCSSYSSKFSTILRLAFNIRLSEYVELQDTGGEDPLPDRLENTTVAFPSRSAKGAEVSGSLLDNSEERSSGP